MTKKLSDQQLIGQEGVHLLGARLLSHGLSFQPTGALDAGIDGFLELRDPATGEVKAQFISAQLKTKRTGNFSEETGESFSYICDQKDLDYWAGSNLPVILIVARLSDSLICWKSIQTWFADPERRRTRKIIFDKSKDTATLDGKCGGDCRWPNRSRRGTGKINAFFPLAGALFTHHNRPAMTDHIFTFGYEGLSLKAFIARLKSADVETVIDVRANPLSRKPGFSKRALSAALHDAGINYDHRPAMGCPKPIRDRYRSDGDWAAYTRGFLAHLKGQNEALKEIARIAGSSRSCLLCFEADFNRCHRTYVARAAAKLGRLQVTHLSDQTEIPDVAVRSAA